MPGIKAAIVATLASCLHLGFDPASLMAPSVDFHLECATGNSAARIDSGLAVPLRLESAVLQNIPLIESGLGQLVRSLHSEGAAKILSIDKRARIGDPPQIH